ncbi:N-acetylmuramoyl-L-alanine amidase family protein [Enterococcus faecium]|uniref:N-acetylmuramoyl-L-alanine amidase family protein n=1 Tax=Enterococcus faecium TaxID=1352 RepID=UPI001F2F8DBE|nr:N-acetylmuramoyl-L-alanine amidase [Enterococcus faecium]EME7191091.1 N-acetylmuramoyl-L-alanine amidase [Enterococcus faecium]MDN3044649.1 N-acetylmuramoyl-L-alanine amidase [Enterococcus faecium]MDQ8259649.1 N-acetylmuramoyl-L-alanine amidase [Enterococcus faecium]MDQ8276177.1 N-acetylmuramoyl-L-alanine amidase [Enterococcus faecium]
MKKIIGAFVFAIIIIIICFQIDVFGQKKIVGQTVSSTNSTVTKTKESFDDTEQETLIKIGKNDRTLYTDDSLTTPLATINGGELAEFLSETKNAYQIKTNDGYTGYLALEDGTKVTKNIQTKPEELSDAVIVLDPGALSNDEQTEEKDITLSTAIKVKKALEDAGATVYLTHTTDELVQLGDICDYSEEKKADVFISLHADSTEYANEATGITTYYYYGQEETLAQTIADSFTDLPLDSRGISTGNYQVLRENLQPSILIEMGYMNNDSDLKELVTDSYQQQIAASLTQALTTYFQ